jgi:cyclopropane-fatty-acyl-phospholipid synthase
MNAHSTALAGNGTLPAFGRLSLALLERLDRGRLELTMPSGERRPFAGRRPGPQAELVLHDWAGVGAALRGGDTGFAEAYRDGLWDSDTLPELLSLGIANEDVLAPVFFGRRWTQWLYYLRHRLRPNSRRGSRHNIHAHYDIGNDFYRLWLDAGMTYSAGLFGTGARTLEASQTAKYERILERLAIGPNDHVLEIGCGWGGFAEHAARTRGCRVTGITLSAAQLAYARERIAAAGLDGRVSLELIDYRDIGGRYDAVVSIEMLEAVGERYWPGYFEILRERLRPDGRAMIQTITIDDAYFERYRRGSDFIQQYIFPGGMLPCPGRLQRLIADADLTQGDCLAFGQDYAETLALWRRRFDEAAEAIRALGYDERFVRLWRFYLAYCEAGFRAGRTDVLHLEIRRAPGA